jgi:hypothetical protein
MPKAIFIGGGSPALIQLAPERHREGQEITHPD